MEERRVSRGPSRYRFRPRRFRFRLVNGKLIETEMGVPAYTLANSFVYGGAAPPESEQRRSCIYLNADGSPADAKAEFLLRRDMTNFLCVLLCRLCPEPTRDEDSSDDPEYWEQRLASEGLPAELRLVTTGGVKPANPPLLQRKNRRQLITLTPSEWRRTVVRRLSLVFSRPTRDPRIQRMTDYFCMIERLHRWPEDSELRPFLEQYRNDERLQRLLGVLATLAKRREMLIYSKQLEQEPFGLVLNTPIGKYTFLYPPVQADTPAGRRQAPVRKFLWSRAPILISRRSFEARWLAATVYIGREFLTTPKRLAHRKLTQKIVAERFDMSRDQLTHAIHRIKNPGFMDKFWASQPISDHPASS